MLSLSLHLSFSFIQCLYSECGDLFPLTLFNLSSSFFTSSGFPCLFFPYLRCCFPCLSVYNFPFYLITAASAAQSAQPLATGCTTYVSSDRKLRKGIYVFLKAFSFWCPPSPLFIGRNGCHWWVKSRGASRCLLTSISCQSYECLGLHLHFSVRLHGFCLNKHTKTLPLHSCF